MAGFPLRVVLLGFSGVVLIAAGGILLRIALRMRDPWRNYRWFTPRPETPSGLDPLPDETWVHWHDPKAFAEEIAQIEREGRHASMLASRYSRVLPSVLDAPLARDPAATTQREPPAGADPDPDVDVVATDHPSGAELTANTVGPGSPDERPAPATTGRADVGCYQPPGALSAADDTLRYRADSRPSQRGNAMGSAERIPTCWKCGLHIVPGKERSAGPDFWAEGPAGIDSFDAEHLDCDPQALVDAFSDYIEELLVGDSSRIEAIRDEVLPTLERLDELVPPEETQS